MGFKNSDSGRKTFVTVADGKFKVKAKEGDEGAIERENKEGKKVWEFRYKELEGYITGVEKSTFKYANQDIDQLKITLVDDEGEVFEVQSNFGGTATQCFLARAENIDYTQLVTLSAYEMDSVMRDGTTKSFTYMSPKQHGENVPAKYGQEDKGLKPWPALVDIMFKGKPAKDNTNRLIEFEAVVSRVQVKIQNEKADRLPPSEPRSSFDDIAPKNQPGRYNAATDFDRPSGVAESTTHSYNYEDDLPF